MKKWCRFFVWFLLCKSHRKFQRPCFVGKYWPIWLKLSVLSFLAHTNKFRQWEQMNYKNQNYATNNEHPSEHGRVFWWLRNLWLDKANNGREVFRNVDGLCTALILLFHHLLISRCQIFLFSFIIKKYTEVYKSRWSAFSQEIHHRLRNIIRLRELI